MSEGYTLKELVGELRQEQRVQTGHTASILASLENIDKHLAQLNSKVATHEKKVQTVEVMQKEVKEIRALTTQLTSFQTRVMAVWGIATFVAVTAINKFL